MMQGLYYVKSLTGQRHVWVQTESQQLQPWTAVSTLLGLVSTLQQAMKYSACRLTSIYSLRWWWPQIKLKSKSLPIGQCHMQNAWQRTIGILMRDFGATNLRRSVFFSDLPLQLLRHGAARSWTSLPFLQLFVSFFPLHWVQPSPPLSADSQTLELSRPLVLALSSCARSEHARFAHEPSWFDARALPTKEKKIGNEI